MNLAMVSRISQLKAEHAQLRDVLARLVDNLATHVIGTDTYALEREARNILSSIQEVKP